ncbi:hypothetical protein SBRCBS47491_008187 [Sporothrix bragantina]|uniref:WD repeat protein n=1 Tax=Sporothrix bragantina TaxID=671064 RepID=A0ABP0CLB9_9PEZI
MQTNHMMELFSEFTNMMQAVVQGQTSHQTSGGPPPNSTPNPVNTMLPAPEPDGNPIPTPATVGGPPPVMNPMPFPMGAGLFNGHVTSELYNLAPTNLTLKRFLVNWGGLGLGGRTDLKVPVAPKGMGVHRMFATDVEEVKYDDLHGDDHDIQGINWALMGITRREARTHREKMYKNYCMNHSDAWKPLPSQVMPQNTETYFRFKKFKLRKMGYMAHFQLRNLLAAPSRSRILYAEKRGVVRQYNSVTGKTSVALRFPSNTRTVITTIATGEGLVVAGGLEGEYCTSKIEPIYGGGEVFDKNASRGFKHLRSGISNHIQVYGQRNGGSPVAALASNDSHLRLMDLTTQKVVSDVAFAFPVNCTAISPDRRLRVVVGDNALAYIVAAEHERSPLLPAGAYTTPDALQTLGGHKDFGFACAWADDGYTLATGFQDRAIKIWDARKTCDVSGIWTPIATLRTTMAGVRSLHFSPAGSGKRVLVAAEEADVINIIDAQTFQKRQAFDVFSEVAGVSFTDNGQDLFALCTDPDRGGLLHLQRNGIMSNAVSFDETAHPTRPGFSSYDWSEPGNSNARKRRRDMRRRLRTAATVNLEPF